MKVKLIWITPNSEKVILHCARVKAEEDAPDESNPRLIKYLIKNKHWSPFEQASACFEVETTRDISRQVIRHRTFVFQEFSQRYHKIVADPIYRDARLQDLKNRQSSLESDDPAINERWQEMQREVYAFSMDRYNEAIHVGIAKEQARALLPEGLTKTRYYQTGNIRSWIHYCEVRRDPTTQREHREIAEAIWEILRMEIPTICEAVQIGNASDIQK